MTRAPVVHSGDVYGLLTVVAEVGRKRGQRTYECICECGNDTIVTSSSLRGGTRSCGCLVGTTGKGGGRPSVHGHTKGGHTTPTFRSWKCMRDRCTQPTSGNYRWYGERGITVCERWRSFENFLSDMGERPEGHTLDRIDPAGNYGPDNCCWATPKEQRANQRAVALT